MVCGSAVRMDAPAAGSLGLACSPNGRRRGTEGRLALSAAGSPAESATPGVGPLPAGFSAVALAEAEALATGLASRRLRAARLWTLEAGLWAAPSTSLGGSASITTGLRITRVPYRSPMRRCAASRNVRTSVPTLVAMS